MFMLSGMRILHVSDIHGNIGAAEKTAEKAREINASLVIVTGDITHFGEIEDAETILERIYEYGKHLFFVPGNCDPRPLLEWAPPNNYVKNLHLKSVDFYGLEFTGLGGAVGKYGTLIEFSEEEVEEMLKKIVPRKRGFVFVSHSPPNGIEVDYTGVKHIGSMAVRRYVEIYQPRLMVCGHAHEGRGIAKINNTVIVNSGSAKNGYCSIIELGEDVEVQLATLY
ncbi:MAG: metallophosphoesterase [Nitrososphaerota archaeon]